MNQKNKIAQIKWACRRGMLELDFILNEFLADGFLKLSDAEHDELLTFLENSDPDLYAWLMGFRKSELAADIKMINLIKKPQ
ncbi:MAG: succinate dehydrogenase assembly factor 2 [Gammaproteobacteria bacterium]|nr:succinate dehydrogenase assembly factor 2 [Gammaproteobacteria bacterium]